MGIEDDIRGALDEMTSVNPNAAVTVSIGGQTGTGYKDEEGAPTELVVYGEQTIVASRLFLDRDDWPEKPSRSGDMIVDGAACVVIDAKTDSARALWVVDYKEQP